MAALYVGSRNNRRIQGSRGHAGGGGMPVRRAKAKPRPEALHRPFVQRSADEIADLYTAGTGRGPVRGRQLHPEAFDALAFSLAMSAERDNKVIEFLPVQLRVHALHKGGEGLEGQRDHWMPLVRAFVLDLELTHAMLAQ